MGCPPRGGLVIYTLFLILQHKTWITSNVCLSINTAVVVFSLVLIVETPFWLFIQLSNPHFFTTTTTTTTARARATATTTAITTTATQTLILFFLFEWASSSSFFLNLGYVIQRMCLVKFQSLIRIQNFFANNCCFIFQLWTVKK